MRFQIQSLKFILACFYGALLSLPFDGQAQGYAVDNSFGTNGVFTYSSPNYSLSIHSVFSNANDKILTLSRAWDVVGGNYNVKGFGLYSLSQNGTPTSPPLSFVPASLASISYVESNGRISLLSVESDTLTVHSYYSDGSPDMTVGVGGTARTVMQNINGIVPTRLIRLSDGSFVLAATMSSDVALIKCTPNGKVDSSFGVNGKAKYHFGNGINCYSTDLKVQLDGKLILVGTAGTPPSGNDEDMLVARFRASGQLDSSFGTSGVRLIQAGSLNDRATNVAIRSDGRIVIVGISEYNNVVAAQLLPNGTLDASFGNQGVFVTQSTGQADGLRAKGMVLLPDGKLVIACDGQYTNGTSIPGLALLRLNTNGTPDLSVSPNGRYFFRTGSHTKDVIPSLYYFSSTPALAVQSDGGVVLGYYYTDSSVNNKITSFAMVRFKPSALGVDETKSQFSRLALYPNPVVADVLNLRFTYNGSTAKYWSAALINAQGKSMGTYRLWEGVDNALPVGGLPSGLYLVQLLRDGAVVETGKLRKE